MIFYVLDSIDVVLREGVIQPGYHALSDFVATPLRMGMILLVAAHGFRLMKGHTQGLSTVDIGWLVLKMAFVTELLINWGFFNAVVFETVWGTYVELADGIASYLDSGRADWMDKLRAASTLYRPHPTLIGLSGDVLDRAFVDQLNGALKQVFSPPPIIESSVPIGIPVPGFEFSVDFPILVPNILANLAGLIALVMTVVLFASVFVVLLLSRLGMTSCLAVAPIFIALALFEHTRSYTDAWFRGMLGFILTPLLLVVVLLVADACVGFLEPVPATGTPLDLFGPAIAYLILYYALAKSVASIPQFASGLVGSMLSHVGGEAAHSLIGGMHKGIDAGVGAAKGAVGGFIKGGPAGAKLGAAQGAAAALR